MAAGAGASMAVNEPNPADIRIWDTLRLTAGWCTVRGGITATTLWEWLNKKVPVDTETYYKQIRGSAYRPARLVERFIIDPRYDRDEIRNFAIFVRDLGVQTQRAQIMLILSLLNYQKAYAKFSRSPIISTLDKYLKDLLINLFFYLDLSQRKDDAKADLQTQAAAYGVSDNANSVIMGNANRPLSMGLPTKVMADLNTILDMNEELLGEDKYPFQSNTNAGAGVGPSFIVGGDGKITSEIEKRRDVLRTQLARERAAAFGPAPAETIPLDELKGRIYFVNSAALESKTKQTVAELCSSVTNGSIVGAAASGKSSAASRTSSVTRKVGEKSPRPPPNENSKANENSTVGPSPPTNENYNANENSKANENSHVGLSPPPPPKRAALGNGNKPSAAGTGQTGGYRKTHRKIRRHRTTHRTARRSRKMSRKSRRTHH
jgi:hypothetical protein